MKKFAALSVTAILIIVGFFATDIVSQQKNDLTKAFNTSITLEKEGKIKDAIAILEPFVETNKTNYLLNLRLGYLYYSDTAWVKSASYYDVALKLRPNSVEALLGLRLPLFAQKQWEKVEGVYNSIIKIDPNNKEANLRLGQIYYYKGLPKFEQGFTKAKPDWDKSKSYLDKVLMMYPSDYEANLAYGYTMYALGMNDKAREAFGTVLMISEKDSLALKGLGLIK